MEIQEKDDGGPVGWSQWGGKGGQIPDSSETAGVWE